MVSIADEWWNEDRRDLFRSAELIASEAFDPTCLEESIEVILIHLELYDDPRQGAGRWLYENELELADRFGVELHGLVGEFQSSGMRALDLDGSAWRRVRATAAELLNLMEANGDH